MNDNENVTDIEVIDDETMGENGYVPDFQPEQALPIEQQKKAINVQDLVFVRQYIDNKMETDVPDKVHETLRGDYYSKTEVNETFYKRTDTVDNAKNAENAAHATDADNAENAVKADYATDAGTATNAYNAENAVNNNDGSYDKLSQDINNVLTVGDLTADTLGSEIIEKKVLIFNEATLPKIDTPIDLSSHTFKTGDVLEIYTKNSIDTRFSGGKIDLIMSSATVGEARAVVHSSSSGKYEVIICKVIFYNGKLYYDNTVTVITMEGSGLSALSVTNHDATGQYCPSVISKIYKIIR